MVLYLSGDVEFVESSQFQDDIPVIGPESSVEKFQWLVPGWDG
jgi:hypothetical protein